MAMTAAGGAPGAPAAQPNVTPMIDVMLVLLIIFMLVVPAVEDGFRAEPPRGEHLRAHPEDEPDHVLGIDTHGELFLDRRPIARDTLGRRLEALYRDRMVDRVLYVKAHRTLDYGLVRDALDAAARSGVRVTAMITEELPPSTPPAGRRP
ncbi:MAG TPA: biopolymer transporter ExbD [Gemmatimonadaceae bacterium]|nr:biopolymer transporter ExbD [Gemmatimonadaceae bacterium]